MRLIFIIGLILLLSAGQAGATTETAVFFDLTTSGSTNTQSVRNIIFSENISATSGTHITLYLAAGTADTSFSNISIAETATDKRDIILDTKTSFLCSGSIYCNVTSSSFLETDPVLFSLLPTKNYSITYTYTGRTKYMGYLTNGAYYTAGDSTTVDNWSTLSPASIARTYSINYINSTTLLNCTDSGSDGSADTIIIVSSSSDESNCYTDGTDDQIELGYAGSNATDGDTIHINAGTYNVSWFGNISWHSNYGYIINTSTSNVTWEGNGSSNTIIKIIDSHTDISPYTVFLANNGTTTVTGLNINNITFDGNQRGNTNWNNNYNGSVGALYYSLTNSQIEDVIIMDVEGDAWYFDPNGADSSYVTFENVFLNGSGHDGFRINNANNITILNSTSNTSQTTATNIGNTAFRIYDSNDVIINNSLGIGNAYGLNLAATADKSGFYISNSRFTSRAFEAGKIDQSATTILSNVYINNTIFEDAHYVSTNKLYPLITIIGDVNKSNQFDVHLNSLTLHGGIHGINIINVSTPNEIYINNSIISNTTQWGINGNATANYNLFYQNGLGQTSNGTVNSNNISSDPLFVSAIETTTVYDSTNDYHLQGNQTWNGTAWVQYAQTSPAIAAGDPTTAIIPPYPSWGIPTRIEMGAYGNTAEASSGAEAATTDSYYYSYDNGTSWNYTTNTSVFLEGFSANDWVYLSVMAHNISFNTNATAVNGSVQIPNIAKRAQIIIMG